MNGKHHYNLTVEWTGNNGTGTNTYRSYKRSHTISVANKVDILASADPTFHGDKTKYNPEELLLAALSGCHLLSYLHVCVKAGVVVTNYIDQAEGTMQEMPDGSGHFTEVILKPIVTVAESSMIDKANELHHQANQLCFIANSVNFPIKHQSTCIVHTADNLNLSK
jgi:organic hydroperoxide reductase OsmC/OhrA